MAARERDAEGRNPGFSQEAVMLRLTETARSEEEEVVRVEGWVTDAGVDLLEREGTRRLRAGVRLVLDLDGVRFIDPVGLELLRRWVGEGVALRGGSAFIRELLREHRLI